MDPDRKRRLIENVACAGACAGALYVMYASHMHYTRPVPVVIGGDEAYIAAFGQRLADGRMLPYVDAVSHRGPMLYLVVGLLAKVWPLSWLPVRVAALVVSLGTLVLAGLAAWRAGEKLAAVIACWAITFVYVGLIAPHDGLGLNGEQVLNLFSMAALAFLVVGLRRADSRGRETLFVLAGISCMLAVQSKQVALVSVGPMLAWVISSAVSTPELTRRMRWRMLAAFGAGLLVPLLLLIGRYAVAGELHALTYWTVTYNKVVYMSPFPFSRVRTETEQWLRDNALELSAVLLLVVGSAGAWLGKIRSWRSLFESYAAQGFLVTVGLQTLLAIVASHSAMRPFQHYWLQTVPWAGLLVGLAVARLAGDVRGLAFLALVIAACGPLVYLTWNLRERLRGIIDPARIAHLDDGVCNFVAAHSSPEQPIFVWGWGANYYINCKRRPASRFVFTGPVAGFVPQATDTSLRADDARAVKGSRDLLIRELEASAPPIIIDEALLGMRRMAEYEPFRRYLSERYCPVTSVNLGRPLYLRKRPDGTCP